VAHPHLLARAHLPHAVEERARLDDVEVRVQAGVDTEGGSLLVLRNMASYASAFDAIPTDEIDAMLAEAQAAVEADRYLFCLPQFVVTGVRTR